MNTGTPVECLLISRVSSELFSTLLLNPLTGTSCGSFKGAELQGGIAGVFEPIGKDANHFCIAIANKPVVYITSLKSTKSDRFASRSILPGVVRCLLSHPSGKFLHATIQNRIFSWAIPSGDLLSIADDAMQEITVLKMTACGSYVVAGLADGNIKLYTFQCLVEDRQHQIEPVRAFRNIAAHSLAVSDLHVTGYNTPRILSVSLDHTVVLSSICVEQPLLKICVDQPVTACCMDPAESRIIIGLKSGKICVVSLYTYIANENVLNVGDSNSMEDATPGLRIFEHHIVEVCKLCVNMDAQLLASADIAGAYCIWDLQNGQCLKSSSMKERVSTFKFTEYWPQLNADENKTPGNAAKRNRLATVAPTIGQLKVNVNNTAPKEALTNLAKSGRRNKINEFLYKQFEDVMQTIEETDPAAISNSKATSIMSAESLFDSNVLSNNEDINADDEVEILEVKSNTTKLATKTKNVNNNAPNFHQAERIRALERELKRLRKINQELYEHAAQSLANSNL